MTERILIQKDFPPVESLSSPGSSGAKAETRSGQTPAEDGSWIGAIAPTM
jgi:hypothetical protein